MNKRELHLDRLRRGLAKISELSTRDARKDDPEFEAWRQEMIQALDVVLPDDNYSIRLANTSFNDHAGSYSYNYIPDHQKYRLNGLRAAELLLTAAIEEAELGPQTSQMKPSPEKEPSIVVNVTNVLTQTVHVELTQLFRAIDALDLAPAERERAKNFAAEIQQETNGKQQWSVLAKSLDGLRELGKTAYKEVAIPLLLELLKKQAGL
jgi:hypothetical protein